jgi:hypothetical protein
MSAAVSRFLFLRRGDALGVTCILPGAPPLWQKQCGGQVGRVPSYFLYKGFCMGIKTSFKREKRYYSPPFSERSVIAVKRLSWALGQSMGATVDFMVSNLLAIIESSKVCRSCKDESKCFACVFIQAG